ncbi:MAG: hypothetical protein GKS01_01480 [Alphaproteobacteria bacterium]|nr:hypothetical protein [Alphaproteobacteria bacterium]
MADTPAKSSSTDSSTAKASEKSASSTSSSPSKSSGEGGKSSKESVGGSSAVHYGYFSNTKTPEYRSGWDDIWSKKKKPTKKRAPTTKKPVTVEIDFSDLPESAREALADTVRVELKKSRINYDNRAKKGDVVWQLCCEVKR